MYYLHKYIIQACIKRTLINTEILLNKEIYSNLEYGIIFGICW